MEKFMAFLKGKKTYIIGVLIVVGAVLEVQFGVDIPLYVYTIAGAAGLTTLRAGVADLKKHI